MAGWERGRCTVGALALLAALGSGCADELDRGLPSASSTVALGGSGGGSGRGGQGGEPAYEPDLDPAAPYALVELFSSEGCSSCPPADGAFASAMQTPSLVGQRVFFLAWHVDYWNYLGHEDRFSSPVCTERQEDYARSVGSNTLFTPQLLINGETTTPYKTLIVSRALGALQEPVGVSVTLWVEPESRPPELRVNHRVADAPQGAELHVVLVERGLSTQVSAGENAGATLDHENVVRAYQKNAAVDGQLVLLVPQGVLLDNSSLLGFVQMPGTMDLAGATSASPYPPVVP